MKLFSSLLATGFLVLGVLLLIWAVTTDIMVLHLLFGLLGTISLSWAVTFIRQKGAV